MIQSESEQSSTMNFWKEIYEEMDTTLNQLQGVVLLAHNSLEFIDIIPIIEKIKGDHFSNILYISLLRSYDYMKNVLDSYGSINKHMHFIDCVSGYAFSYEDRQDNCMYYRPPQNLQDLKEILTFGLDHSGADIVILDSLSQLVNFSQPTSQELFDLYRFLQSLREKELNLSSDTFILLYDSKMTMMRDLPRETIDHIFKIELGKTINKRSLLPIV